MLGHGEWLLAGTFTLAAEVEVLLRVPGPSWRQAITAATGLSLVIVRWRSGPFLAMAASCRGGGERVRGEQISPRPLTAWRQHVSSTGPSVGAWKICWLRSPSLSGIQVATGWRLP